MTPSVETTQIAQTDPQTGFGISETQGSTALIPEHANQECLLRSISSFLMSLELAAHNSSSGLVLQFCTNSDVSPPVFLPVKLMLA